LPYLDLVTSLHKATTRNYLERVNDLVYPKAKAAQLAKQWGYDYWDGDRRINYGGYRYIPGRWAQFAKKLIEYYELRPGDKVLDVGCGKGFQLFELGKACPGLLLRGLDISEYALKNSHSAVSSVLDLGCASKLPYADKEFKLAVSLNTLHNLHNKQLESALRELQRVAQRQYLCVESYRNEEEKANLIFWQVTCEQFNSPEDWEWWFKSTGYTGEYSFIFFE